MSRTSHSIHIHRTVNETGLSRFYASTWKVLPASFEWILPVHTAPRDLGLLGDGRMVSERSPSAVAGIEIDRDRGPAAGNWTRHLNGVTLAIR